MEKSVFQTVKIEYKKILLLLLLASGLFFTLWTGWKYPLGDRCDFQLFYNELKCFQEGVDPHNILIGKEESPRYYPYKSLYNPPEKKQVAYRAPWLYTFGGFLGFLKEKWAMGIVFLANSLSWLFLGGMAYLYARGKELSLWDSLLAALISLSFYYPVSLCLQVGNFGNMAAMGAMGLVLASGKKREILAGVFLTILMFKIQMAALFLFPLFLRKEYKSIAVAGVLTLAGCIYPSWASGTAFWKVIANIAHGGSYLEPTNGGLLSIFFKVLSRKEMIIGDLLISLPLFFYATYLVRKEKDPLLVYLPSAVFALLWTYSWPHDRLLLALPLLYFTTAFLKKPCLLYGIGSLLFLGENGEFFWHTLVRYGFLDPAGRGWIYHGYNFFCFISWIVFLLCFLSRKEKSCTSPAAFRG